MILGGKWVIIKLVILIQLTFYSLYSCLSIWFYWFHIILMQRIFFLVARCPSLDYIFIDNSNLLPLLQLFLPLPDSTRRHHENHHYHPTKTPNRPAEWNNQQIQLSYAIDYRRSYHYDHYKTSDMVWRQNHPIINQCPPNVTKVNNYNKPAQSTKKSF